MTQRVRSCANNTNLDTIHCDAYMSQLLKQEKNVPGTNKAACPRERSLSRPKTAAIMTSNPTNQSRNRPVQVRQQNAPLIRASTASGNVIHKDVHTDNAGVVGLAAKGYNTKHKTSSSSASKESWGKLLKSGKSNENMSSFNCFDPLRTLHFLVKELNSKIHISLPNDNSMHRMILDMQHALNRVPPEVASAIHLHHDYEVLPLKRSKSDIQHRAIEQPEKLTQRKPKMFDKLVQTALQFTTSEAENFQKQLEASTFKLEANCKHLEHACSQLNLEKKEIERKLLAEEDTVQFLRNQMTDIEVEKTTAINKIAAQLQKEKDDLETEVQKLKAQVESQQGPTSNDLKLLIVELRTQKAEADQEIMSIRHELASSNLEKEKFMAMLTVRDQQIKEIQYEMSSLQDIVNDQLLDLEKSEKSDSEQTSQISVLEYPSQRLPAIEGRENNHMGDSPTLSSMNESTIQQLFIKDKETGSFRDIPSGDSSLTTIANEEIHLLRSDVERMTPTRDFPSKKVNRNGAESLSPGYGSQTESQASIRDIFAELKRQALSVGKSISPPQKIFHLDGYSNEKLSK